jgi:hypothetical protein
VPSFVRHNIVIVSHHRRLLYRILQQVHLGDKGPENTNGATEADPVQALASCDQSGDDAVTDL